MNFSKWGLNRANAYGTYLGNWPVTASEGSSRHPKPPSSRRSTMKKIVYSLAVMLRVARADKLSVPYRYY